MRTELLEFTKHYTAAALYYGVMNDDERATESALSDCTIREINSDCRVFYAQNRAFLEQAIEIYGVDHAAQDFYLTRCGHGAGYWDGDLPDRIGHPLTEASEKFGVYGLYVGDDGKVYSHG